MTGKRERNKETNRTAILDAARRCFIEQGYETVTIRDVIRLTGLAAGTFYNYFPDKESLLHALIAARMSLLSEHMHEARRRAATIEEFLFETYRTAYEEICADTAFFALMFRNEPAVRSLYGDHIVGIVMGALREDLEQAITRGVLGNTSAEYLTAILFGAGYEMSRLLIEKPESERRPREAAMFTTRLLLSGIAAPSAQTPMIRRGAITLKGTAR